VDNLGLMKAAVWDMIDSDESDPYHTATQVTRALNDALITTADRLCATVARRRYMKRIADLAGDEDFEEGTGVWTLPDDFRRPFALHRNTAKIIECQEHEFSTFGADGYIVVGRELILTEGTSADDLEVWYFYTPPVMSGDDDVPDFIEGYEQYLVLLAAARRSRKGDTADASGFLQEASMIWPDLLAAARQSSMPSTIRSVRGAHGEDWT
jgi:hypothetical protein